MSTPTSRAAVEMRHLRLVAAISEQGSMTAAARVLDLTQPALSHQLREVETRLRSPLFVRTARRMVLTPAGEQLLHVARTVLAQVDEFERQVVDGDFADMHGQIRIATECYTAYHWLPAVLRDFRERWPGVDLRVGAEHTSAPVRALRDGALDLALVYTRVDDKRIRLEPLFDDELVAVVAPNHRFAGREFISLPALGTERFFVYTSPDPESAIVRDILEPAGVRASQITRLQLTEAIVELVAAGLGIAILAKWAVAPAVRSGVVHALRIGKRGIRRTWFTATRSADVTPAYQADLVELLRRHLGSGPVVRAG